MIPEEIVVAVRRMEKRLLDIEIGNQASLRRLEQKLEMMTAEMAALKAEAAAAKKAVELPSMVKTPTYPAPVPSLVPAQLPRIYRQKTNEGEFIIA